MLPIISNHVSGFCWDIGPQSPSFFFIVIFFFFSFFSAFLLTINNDNNNGCKEVKEEIALGLPSSVPEKSVKDSDMLQHHNKVEGLAGGSCGLEGNFLLMAELRKKIMSFRDILDLSPCNGSILMNELLMGTVGDLHELYPAFISCPLTSEMKSTSTYQGLCRFHGALGSVENSWSKTHNWCDKFSNEKDASAEDLSFEQLGEMVLKRLGHMNKAAKEIFDLADEEEKKNSCTIEDSTDLQAGDLLKDSHCPRKASYCKSPHTPTSVLPDINIYSLNIGAFPKLSRSPPLLLPLTLKRRVTGKLKPIDVKRLSLHMFPHVSIQNFTQVNKINEDASEANNYETSMNSKALPMDVTISSVNSLMMDDIAEVLDPVLHDVTGEKMDGSGIRPTKRRALSPNPPPPPMLLAKESAPPSLPEPQPMLPPLQSATPPPTPNHPAPPATHLPMLLPKHSTSSPLQAPPTPNNSELPAQNLPMLLPKQSSPPPPLPPTPLKQSAVAPPSAPVLPPKKSPPPPPPTAPTNEYEGPPLSATPSGPPKESASQPRPPPPKFLLNGPPPPPPLVGNKALRPKKANTKLKRSTQMGSLYRLLKGKVEGSSFNGKISHVKKGQVGGSAENKGQGMADALAEMTKRSAYFQQIEEDVQKHAKLIMEMKSAINSFQTQDMAELLKFHQYVELHLEDLTDETQVLARFEDFPTKKLEIIRSAATMYSKLEGIATNLESWKIEVPLTRQLEKVECYFNKIKVEVDAIERSKDEDAKRFQSQKIEFNFSVLLRIKELMVDVSSNCIEMALKESKETKEDADRDGGTKHNARLKACSQTLWKAFQLAFRVYNFAGGQDDRADKLTNELAQEIETYANHY